MIGWEFGVSNSSNEGGFSSEYRMSLEVGSMYKWEKCLKYVYRKGLPLIVGVRVSGLVLFFIQS